MEDAAKALTVRTETEQAGPGLPNRIGAGPLLRMSPSMEARGAAFRVHPGTGIGRAMTSAVPASKHDPEIALASIGPMPETADDDPTL